MHDQKPRKRKTGSQAERLRVILGRTGDRLPRVGVELPQRLHPDARLALTGSRYLREEGEAARRRPPCTFLTAAPKLRQDETEGLLVQVVMKARRRRKSPP